MVVSLPQIRTSTTGIASSEASQPTLTLGAATPQPTLTRANKTRRFRRANRGQETSDWFVQRAIPEGMQRPDHTHEVLEAFKAHPDYAVIRSDRRTALARCLDALIATADFSTMTTRPSWAKLAQILGVTRRSVARYLQQLRTMGLLGVVASGRSAEFAAKGPDGQRINEVAVYVLCVPKKPRKIKAFFGRLLGINPKGVDRCVTPPSEAGYYLSNKEVNPRTRARKRTSKSKEQKRLGYSIAQVRWNKHWVPKSRRQQLTAAWRLKTILPHVLGEMSDQDIASCLRPFFEAEWSVADIHHALDWRPDGTVWPHSGAPDTKAPHRIRGWLKYRLQAWQDAHEQPIRSKTQMDEARRTQARRQRQREVEREAARRDQVRSVDQTVIRQAFAKMRALVGRRRR